MELQVKKGYNLDNLVKDWGFEKVEDWDYTVYIKECTDKESCLKIYDDRDVFIMLEEQHIVDDETLCLLYDLIQAGIIEKVQYEL